MKPDFQAQALEILKDFTFTQICNTADYQIWKCARPHARLYAFDIVITLRKIFVGGDLDGLVFNVGADYGLPFLAGLDVGYYILSKLEPQCREMQYDPESVEHYLYRQLFYYVFEELPVTGGFHENSIDKLPALAEAVDKLLNEKAFGTLTTSAIERLLKVVKLYLETGFETEHEFYHQVNSLADILDTADLTAPTKPSDKLMLRLYVVNEAAKAILQQQAALAA